MLGPGAIVDLGGFAWVAHHGYFAIAGLLVLGIAGVPIPDEALLAFAGYLVWRGQLSLPLTIVAAFAGSVGGISLSYLLGRVAGGHLIRRFGARLHVTPERLKHTHSWFSRYGRWTLSVGCFVPGLRHLTAFSAGMSRLDLPSFALFAYLGALLWASTSTSWRPLASCSCSASCSGWCCGGSDEKKTSSCRLEQTAR
jgi:membrane protein DedA with SNARE-associated domain